ncbi:ferritin-like domain-containing protein [Parapedobacter sp. ISTM3]|uniref:ferritin-like domain-containing protein n=1 Tax=Parapedobacter sp. ISTM3 TaxID=2800130 RepID=UPI001902CD9C|nr:ferritin-like domain-containing protein [Parapedobacter sp. ISTM3]MBK1440228.1 ferritin-like domain-containing protein [Parapedobacter sp. ISTM3]
MKTKTNPETAAKTGTLDNAEPTLHTLLLDTVRDLYWAENHLIKALSKMSASASSEALKKAITKHLNETKTQVGRLEKIFEMLGEKAVAKKCDAMEGLTKEGEAIIETTPAGTQTRDVGIIFASKKVEHYEIASYLGAYQLATTLGLSEVGEQLQETLQEEQQTDKLLAEMVGEMLAGTTEKMA